MSSYHPQYQTLAWQNSIIDAPNHSSLNARGAISVLRDLRLASNVKYLRPNLVAHLVGLKEAELSGR